MRITKMGATPATKVDIYAGFANIAFLHLGEADILMDDNHPWGVYPALNLAERQPPGIWCQRDVASFREGRALVLRKTGARKLQRFLPRGGGYRFARYRVKNAEREVIATLIHHSFDRGWVAEYLTTKPLVELQEADAAD